MKINTLLSLLNDLLSCDVYFIGDREKDTPTVAEKINPNGLFEEFTGEYLLSFFDSMKDSTYYELINALGERLFMFRLEAGFVVIGPYLKRTIDEKEIARRMFKNKVPSQFFNILKSQYYGCAILDSFNIRNTVGACLSAYFADGMVSYDFVKINHFETPSLITVPEETSDKLYENIYKKYEIENDLLYKIEHGLVDELKASSTQLASLGSSGMEMAYFSSHPKEAMASLRAMVRVVAVRSGLSIVIIDEILSKYTNLMREAKTAAESVKLIESFQLEMTKEIREYRSHVPPCSQFMKSVTEYIILNYNTELSLSSLAEKFKISPSYLSHVFKREINKGVKEFIEEIRISNACRFIESTDMSISQIGYAVGYLDNNYFTKVFKKTMKMTPRKYREQSLRL
ncbi:MAG: helix-turn-helix transcriptional regulator [Clostridia bacterium]|nr:helix-turn-helix transcriptional regulator [Clostridia bacterium]